MTDLTAPIEDLGFAPRAKAVIEVDLSHAESVALLDGFRNDHNIVGVLVASQGLQVRCTGRVVSVESTAEPAAGEPR